MSMVYIGAGSNLGDRQTALSQARDELAALPHTRAARLSPVYETAPVGGPAGQGPFLNAVIELETDLPPRELLTAMQRIEQAAGRPVGAERIHWGPRTLDLDLLLYDELVLDEPGLHVPHPRMHERWFVLKPLADLASQRVHPVLGRTIAELLAAVEKAESRE